MFVLFFSFFPEAEEEVSTEGQSGQHEEAHSEDEERQKNEEKKKRPGKRIEEDKATDADGNQGNVREDLEEEDNTVDMTEDAEDREEEDWEVHKVGRSCFCWLVKDLLYLVLIMLFFFIHIVYCVLET